MPYVFLPACEPELCATLDFFVHSRRVGLASSVPPTTPEGPTVGRRGIKEYRAPEALILIAADRDQRPLVCPSCNGATIERVPVRSDDDVAARGNITLHCASCCRTAVYIARTLSRSSLP